MVNWDTIRDSLPNDAQTVRSGNPQGQVILRTGKETQLVNGHPWVWDSSVERVEGDPGDGDVVDVLCDGRFVGRGVYNHRSHLRVRLYSWTADQPLDEEFWRATLQRALCWRQRLGLCGPHRASRLVFSESDGLSGLVVDQYDEHLVLQVNALAIAARLQTFTRLLAELIQPASITVRSTPAIEKSEGFPALRGCLWGHQPPKVTIREAEVVFEVDVASGQKTGYYIDQRDNRPAVASYLAGRNVLDVFCYSGGFSLHALAHGQARNVLGIDSSRAALDMARHNAMLNAVQDRVEWVCEDAFTYLQDQCTQGSRFGAVILDPPKFAPTRYHVKEALRAYHRLNRLAVELLEPDGILVTCSCSGSVSRSDFLDMLFGVSQKTRRSMQVIEQRGQCADHPVLLACPETEYLKCVICRVL